MCNKSSKKKGAYDIFEAMMEHAPSNSNISDDCIITLNSEHSFNVSKILKKYKSTPSHVIEQMNKFAMEIDNKIHIKGNDPRYKTIYDGTETSVKRLCEQLKQNNLRYENAYIRRTGSIESDVKVALPHESDYLLYVQEDKIESWKKVAFPGGYLPYASHATVKDFKDQLYIDVGLILEHSMGELTSGLCGSWIIHVVKQHRVGICLYMAFKDKYNAEEAVGVTTDIVPVVNAQNLHLNTSAKLYLPKTIAEYTEHGSVYRLMVGETAVELGLVGETTVDTGEIENDLIKDLPDGIRRGFRLAKYLTQLFIFDDSMLLSESVTLQKTFGFKLRIKSYHLRVCLMHLLIQSQGHSDVSYLTDSVLALCLLEMYRSCINIPTIVGDGRLKGYDLSYLSFDHPLLEKSKESEIVCRMHQSRPLLRKLNKIIAVFRRTAPMEKIKHFSLLNSSEDNKILQAKFGLI